MTAKSTVLAQLVRVVASEGSDQSLPLRLARAASAILGADGAAITLCYTETTRLTVCATDEVAARLEDLQTSSVKGRAQTPTTPGAWFAPLSMSVHRGGGRLSRRLPMPRWGRWRYRLFLSNLALTSWAC